MCWMILERRSGDLGAWMRLNLLVALSGGYERKAIRHRAVAVASPSHDVPRGLLESGCEACALFDRGCRRPHMGGGYVLAGSVVRHC